MGRLLSPSPSGQQARASEKRPNPPTLATASPAGVSPVESRTFATRFGTAMSTSPVANSSEEEIRTNVLVLMVEAYSRLRLKSSNRLYLACSPGPTRWNPDGLETGVAGDDHEPRG